MADFIQEYFLNPILDQAHYAPYNVYNTAVYAILALLAVYLIYKGLERAKIPVDRRFVEAILPFVFFGGIFRVFEDAQLLPRVVSVGGVEFYPFITPYIYVVVFLLLVVTSAVAWLVLRDRQKMLDAVKTAGVAYDVAAFAFLLSFFRDVQFGLAIAGLSALAFLAYRFLNEKRGIAQNAILSWMVFGQVFDGAATFVGTGFAGYSEQHVLGNFIIGSAGPWLFFLVKIAFAFLAAEFLRKEKDENPRNFVALLITIFGLAPGTRDVLRIVAGV
ncbi:MAG: DUF63 family protein [Candidatus Micrarchaeota archaeon]|nr:DUF63 family protein [Candidatus Micrarchaeota archaeon]